MSAQGIPLKSDFSERARANDIPVASLLDLRQRRPLMGALRSCWQPDCSMQIPWERCMVECFAILPMRQWGWRLPVSLRRGILHYRRTESQFLSPDLAGTTQSGRNRVQRGRTIGYVECDITDEENRLAAKAACTCMVLRGQKSAGR